MTLGERIAAFMLPLVTNPFSDQITAQLSAAPNFTPGDAVVFLVPNQNKSVRAGNLGPPAPNTLGRSSMAPDVPSVCEVDWERCFNDLEVAGALFHEAAHGMSLQGDGTHQYRIPGVGGPGVRVLAAQQPGVAPFPSHADLEFYTSAIRRRMPFVTCVR